jgi:hypothetical protein
MECILPSCASLSIELSGQLAVNCDCSFYLALK